MGKLLVLRPGVSFENKGPTEPFSVDRDFFNSLVWRRILVVVLLGLVLGFPALIILEFLRGEPAGLTKGLKITNTFCEATLFQEPKDFKSLPANSWLEKVSQRFEVKFNEEAQAVFPEQYRIVAQLSHQDSNATEPSFLKLQVYDLNDGESQRLVGEGALVAKTDLGLLNTSLVIPLLEASGKVSRSRMELGCHRAQPKAAQASL